MSDLKPCPFCGGEVSFWTREESEDYQVLIIDCEVCPANMEEWVYKYDKNFAENFEKKKAEMFEAWNKRIERTAKVIKHKYWLGVSLNVVGGQTIGYEWLCENCKKRVIDGDDYCSHCGEKLIWFDEEDIPMEYFESGGR